MFLASILALLTFATPSSKPRSHLPATGLADVATILAHDEGWPLANPDYTFATMTPDVDDGFDSIGLYNKSHLVRMYSVDRTTGDILDFMRGCQIFRFDNLTAFQQHVRSRSRAPALTDRQLAAKAGCPKLTVVNTRWVH